MTAAQSSTAPRHVGRADTREGEGSSETPLAARISPLNPATNMRFYKNLDIHSADNSNGAKALAGTALPGDIGANPISNTLPDWIIARMGQGGVDLPAFETHPTAEQR
jgi:hypothetical protein